MIWCTKALATKLEDLSLIPEVHMVEGENWHVVLENYFLDYLPFSLFLLKVIPKKSHAILQPIPRWIFI